MNKIFSAFLLILISSFCLFAQSSDDYKKGEFFVGYSNNIVDMGFEQSNSVRTSRPISVIQFFDDRYSFNGFEVSAVGNISRYVGIKADVSGAYLNKNFNPPIQTGTGTANVNFRGKSSRYNFLGGVQFKDNSSEARVKPFAHVLAGAGHARFEFTESICLSGNNCSALAEKYSETGLAGAIGGGIDIKLGNRVDLRLIQVDYNPIRLKQDTEQNFRFSVGLVFK